MKARIPKEWDTMSYKQKERLKEYCVEVATEAAKKQEEANCRIILDAYIKMVCCVLHDAFKFGEKRLTYFLGNHRRMFANQARMVSKGTQQKYLDKRMAEIFKKDGFPKEFIDSLIGEVEVIYSDEKEE